MNIFNEYRVHDTLTKRWVREPVSINSHTGEVICSRPQDFDIMQTIGIFDCTKFEELTEIEQIEYAKYKDYWFGKPIFDCDIVECYDKEKDIWNIECVRIGDLSYTAPFSFRFRTARQIKDSEPCSYKYEAFKIIGNKFDNPELWEKHYD